VKDTIITKIYESPLGELLLGSFSGELCLCDWRYRKMRQAVDTRICNFLDSRYEVGTSEVLEATTAQLDEYFDRKRQIFDIPLKLCGSDFQISVWQELLKVPFGKTITYMKLTEKLGDPKAIRAVARANGANAISILVPCHRIIGSDGSLVGYAGGIEAKRKLLDLEESLMAPTLF
jgi:methylated-DNA-[protein]-cysteine S-methyltransferase